MPRPAPDGSVRSPRAGGQRFAAGCAAKQSRAQQPSPPRSPHVTTCHHMSPPAMDGSGHQATVQSVVLEAPSCARLSPACGFSASPRVYGALMSPAPRTRTRMTQMLRLTDFKGPELLVVPWHTVFRDVFRCSVMRSAPCVSHSFRGSRMPTRP